MTADTLDHQRAREANEDIPERFKDSFDEKRFNELKKIRSVLLSSVAELRQVGLLQLTAFWMSKNESEHRFALDCLRKWFAHEDCPVKPLLEGPYNQFDQLFKALLESNTQTVSLFEAEAEAYLEWLRRLIEGLYKEHQSSFEKKSTESGAQASDANTQEEGDA